MLDPLFVSLVTKHQTSFQDFSANHSACTVQCVQEKKKKQTTFSFTKVGEADKWF